MIGHHVRYAFRVLSASPGFTAAAVITLALGIGANTALFSVFDALLLKSLPVAEPDRLAVLSVRNARGEPNLEFSFPVFKAFEARSRTLAGLAAGTAGSDRTQVRVPPAADIETATLALVSGNFFHVLGTPAALGRVFSASDDAAADAEPVAVLNHKYWTTRFGASPTVLGRQLIVQNVAFTVVGVAPRGFFGHVVGESPDIWVPAGAQPRLWGGLDYLGMTQVDWLRLVGRLAPGTTHAAAQAELERTFADLGREWKGTPQGRGFPAGATLVVSEGRRGFSDLRTRFEGPLKILAGVVTLVLLLTCVNVAGLLTARTAAREREIAVRIAVGAGRGHLTRQFLIESLVLAAIGGSAGLLVGLWGTDALIPLLAERGALPPLTVRIDARLLAFTAVVSTAAGLAFGVLPVWRYARRHSAAAGRERGTARRPAVARGLVVAQLGLSVVLVVGAGLFVRTLQSLRAIDAGFERQHVLMLRVEPFAAGYRPVEWTAINTRLVAALEAIPGVTSVSQSGIGLMSGLSRTCCLTIAGYAAAADERIAIRTNDVTPNYFATVGMRLTAGRTFEAQDAVRDPQPVIVNEAFVRRYLGGAPPLGRTFGFGQKRNLHVAAVVADARYDGLRAPAEPLIFFPARNEAPLQSIELRTSADPRAIAASARRAVADNAPRLPLREMVTIEQLVDSALAQERLMARLSGFFGILAVTLACVGVYGLLAQLVTRRTNEIGIRMALGADRRDVIGIVVREAVLLVTPGLIVGVAAAAALARLTSSLLFGVTPGDPVSLLFAPLCLGVTALAAAWIPARRAAGITPLVALRHE